MDIVDEKYNAALNMAGYETLIRCTEEECKKYAENDSLPEGIIRSDVIGVFYKPAQPPTAEQVDNYCSLVKFKHARIFVQSNHA